MLNPIIFNTSSEFALEFQRVRAAGTTAQQAEARLMRNLKPIRREEVPEDQVQSVAETLAGGTPMSLDRILGVLRGVRMQVTANPQFAVEVATRGLNQSSRDTLQ